MPLRVEVTPVVSGPEDGSKEVSPVKVKVSAWETYRGNDWGNKGEAAARENGIVEVRALATKTYYMERSSCECPCQSTLNNSPNARLRGLI